MKTYSAWNEANHVSQPTSASPLAVRYYDVLRRDARSRKCTVMAADVLDPSNVGSYLRAFMRRAKGHPRLWGLHNYKDVNRKTSGDTRRMLATVPGEVWLTETGGIVRFAGSRLKTSPARAAAARSTCSSSPTSTSASARAAVEDHAAVRLPWFGETRGARFDAGLVNPDGSPRTAFAIVRKNAREHR